MKTPSILKWYDYEMLDQAVTELRAIIVKNEILSNTLPRDEISALLAKIWMSVGEANLTSITIELKDKMPKLTDKTLRRILIRLLTSLEVVLNIVRAEQELQRRHTNILALIRESPMEVDERQSLSRLPNS